MSEPKQGRFVVVEGIDGAGKTTLVANLAKLMPPTTLFLRCNRDTAAGVCARGLINEKHHDYAIQAAMIADKFILDRAIRKARAEGRDVVVDRWTPSAMAYNPLMRHWLAEPAKHLSVPTHVLFLDLTINVAMDRISARGDADMFETKERLRSCLAYYRVEACTHSSWHMLDAMVSPETLAAEAFRVITSTT